MIVWCVGCGEPLDVPEEADGGDYEYSCDPCMRPTARKAWNAEWLADNGIAPDSAPL